MSTGEDSPKITQDTLEALNSSRVEVVTNINSAFVRSNGDFLEPALLVADPTNETENTTNLLLQFFVGASVDLEMLANSDQETRRQETLEFEARRKLSMFKGASEGGHELANAVALTALSKNIPYIPKNTIITHYMLDSELDAINRVIRPPKSADPNVETPEGIDLWVVMRKGHAEEYRAARFAGLRPRVQDGRVIITPIVEDSEGNPGRVPEGYRIISSGNALYVAI